MKYNKENPFRVLSWGGGTQSTALGEMSTSGETEKLDAILFADTGFERQGTYEAVDFYMGRWRKKGLHVEIVSGGDIEELGAAVHKHMPLRTDSGSPLLRECTREFKITPVKRRVRELMGFDKAKKPDPPSGSVEGWIGFSTDEYHRMGNKRLPKYWVNRYPLIEMRIMRWDSIKYLENKGLPVPIPSACIGCPFRKPGEWLEMSKEVPFEFKQAVEFDERIRRQIPKNVKAENLYIYRKGIPLIEADLESDAKKQKNGVQIPMMFCIDGQCMT